MTQEPVTTWPCDSVELRKGELITFKGKLEAVHFSKNPIRTYGGIRVVAPGPMLAISFADWSLVEVSLRDEYTARNIPIPLSSYVTVKAQVIDEDGTIEAIAIWKTPGGVPIPLV